MRAGGVGGGALIRQLPRIFFAKKGEKKCWGQGSVWLLKIFLYSILTDIDYI